MSKTLVIVDGNNKAWASYHAYSRLSFKGFSTSIIYGMTTMVRSYLNKFKPDEFFIVWDGRKSKYRLELLPDYKGGRTHKLTVDYEQFLKQKTLVQKMFNYLGIKQIHNEYAEADDMIYKLTRLSKKKGFTDVIIVSTDKDFHQLINHKNPRVRVYSDRRKSRDLLDVHNLQEKMGYKAYQTVDYLTLVGDNSDNIPGYNGIGPKKASDLLNQYGSLVNFLDSNDDHNIIDRETLLDLIERNKLLIDLKYFYQIHKKDLKTIFYRDDNNPKINLKKFRKIAAKYNMVKIMGKSFLKPFKQLKQ